jgi:hypothetical protein
MALANEDGATVPIYYESRLVALELSEEAKTELDNLAEDLIEDEEERIEAKRIRAIAQRKLRAKEEGLETKPEPSSPFATKDDLKKLATNEAKKLVAPEVKELWNELAAIQLGGFDPMDAESVAANMADRYIVYRAKNPVEGEDPTAVFTTSPDVPKSGGPKTAKKESKPLPGYKDPVQPTEWY